MECGRNKRFFLCSCWCLSLQKHQHNPVQWFQSVTSTRQNYVCLSSVQSDANLNPSQLWSYTSSHVCYWEHARRFTLNKSDEGGPGFSRKKLMECFVGVTDVIRDQHSLSQEPHRWRSLWSYYLLPRRFQELQGTWVIAIPEWNYTEAIIVRFREVAELPLGHAIDLVKSFLVVSMSAEAST